MPLAVLVVGSQRCDTIRDVTADLLDEICHSMSTELELQPLSGNPLRFKSANAQDGVHLDMKAQGFWGDRHQYAFFGAWVFNPLCQATETSLTRTIP